MIIRIINKSIYDYRRLSFVIRKCIREVRKTEGGISPVLAIHIDDWKKKYYKGLAARHRCRIRLILPQENLSDSKLAIITLHEYGHILGIPHSKRKALSGWATGTIEHLYKDWINENFKGDNT